MGKRTLDEFGEVDRLYLALPVDPIEESRFCAKSNKKLLVGSRKGMS